MKRLLVALIITTILAIAVPAEAKFPSLVTPTTRNGMNDWNFLYGSWHTHYMRLRKILQHDHHWYPCEGTSTITPFWHGGANLEDGDLKCPHQYILGMTTRLYNPVTHQWTLWWGTRRVGITEPPQVGHFDANGVGLFYSDDTWAGTPVIVRYKWTHPNGKPRFEQAFSTDHGKTWETNWTTDYTR